MLDRNISTEVKLETRVAPLFSLKFDLPALAEGSRRRALHDQLKAAIIDGRLARGLQLPASRTLARQLGLSRNSIVAVYERLISQGFVSARQGAGSFVTDAGSWASSGPEHRDLKVLGRLSSRWQTQAPATVVNLILPFDMRLGAPDMTLFPHDIWLKLVNRSSRRKSGRTGDDQSPYGVLNLRQAIAFHVSLTRAVGCSAKDVLVTHGAQQAFDLLARILVEAGHTVVAVEDPGYPPLPAAFAAAGAVVCPVRVDQEGMVIDDIPPTAKVICVTPSHQFPLGVPMSSRRRLQLLEFADHADAVIIEDDYDGEFRFQDRPLDALQTLDRSQRVFYVGTFSKCMMRDLRLGFVVCPAWAMNALARAEQLSDGYCSAVHQDALAAFISEGHLRRHVRRMRTIYARRRATLLSSLVENCGACLQPFPAEAGLHIAAALSGGVGAEELAVRAAKAGIGVRTIAEFATGERTPKGIVIGYGSIDEHTIRVAIAALGDICRRICL